MGGLYNFDNSLVYPINSVAMTDDLGLNQILLQNENDQEYKQARIVVYSVDKRVVHQESIDIKNLSEIPSDFSSLKNGLYFVKVYVDGENVLNKKVLKVK